MHLLGLILSLGLINWLATTIVVESELFRPLRDWTARRHDAATLTGRRRAESVWEKARYLIGGHLCAGTWIGLILALSVPGVRPYGTGLIGWALAGLLIKGVGHLTLVAHKAGEAVATSLTQPRRAPQRVLTRQEHAEMAELMLAEAQLFSGRHPGRPGSLRRADMATTTAGVHAALATLADDPADR